MWKKDSSIIWLLYTVGFLSLSFADKRIIDLLPLYPLDLIAGAIIIAGLFLGFKQIARPQSSYAKNIWIALGIFWLSSILSCCLNSPTATGVGQLKSWVILPSLAGFLVPFLLSDQKRRNQNFLQALFFGLATLLIILLPYLIFNARTFDGRLQGPFTSPNFLAFFLVPSTLLSYYFYKQAQTLSYKIILGALIAFSLLCLFETHSFGGWLSFIGACSWYFFSCCSFKTKNFFQVIMFSLLFVGILFGAELILNNKLDHIFEERSSLASRITIWTVAVDAIKDNPVFGIGVGKFQEVYLSYQPKYPPYLEWAVPQPHNIFLALWLQTGILGLVVFLWFLWKALLPFRSQSFQKEHVLLQSFLVSILIYGIFDTPLFGNELSFFFWTVLGFILFPQRKAE